MIKRAENLLRYIKSTIRRHWLIWIIILAVCVAQWVRLFFGVSCHDESWYFTHALRFVQGDKLFLDSWDSTQTQGIFLIPAYYLYTIIFGYEGLILYGRILFFLLSLIVAILFFYAAREDFGGCVSAGVSLILVVYAPFSLYTIGYNELNYSLGILGMLMLYIGVKVSKYNKRHWLIIAMGGVIHAAMVASYPAIVVVLPLTVLILLFYSCKIEKLSFSKALKFAMEYIGGLSVIAILLVLYIIFVVGIDNFLLCIEKILDYNSSVHAITAKIYFNCVKEVFAHYMLGDIWVRFLFMLMCAFSFATYFKRTMLHTKKFKITASWAICCCVFLIITVGVIYYKYAYAWIYCCVFAVFMGVCILWLLDEYVYEAAIVVGILWIGYSIFYCFTHFDNGNLDNLLTIDIVAYVACLFPLVILLPMEKEKIKWKWFWILTMLSLLQAGIVSYSSGGLCWQGRYALIGTVLYILLIFAKQIEEHFSEKIKWSKFKCLCKGSFPLLAVFIVVSMLLIGEYIDCYGDYNFLAGKDTCIQSGPGKGIYTSASNAELLDEMAENMHKYAIDGGKLLVLEVFPYAYGVLPNMETFTQSTWAPTLYILGSYTRDIYKAPIFDYFEHEGAEPDMIFYYGNATFLEKPDPNYKMHEYIIDNYIPVVRKDMYTIFTRKQ